MLRLAPASCQLKGHDSALAYLEGGQYFLGAFQGLGDAVTLGTTVSAARPSVPGLAPAVAAEKVGGVNISITREGIVRGLDEVVEPHLGAISKLDRDALVGFRGSLARGFKGEHKGGVPFDPGNFDIDAFIVSDKLAAQFGRKAFFRSSEKIDGIMRVQGSIDTSLRKSPVFGGLRRDPFTFRIYSARNNASPG